MRKVLGIVAMAAGCGAFAFLPVLVNRDAREVKIIRGTVSESTLAKAIRWLV